MSIPAPNMADTWVCRLSWETDTIDFMNVLAVNVFSSTETAQNVLTALQDGLEAALTATEGTNYRALLDADVRLAGLQVTRYDETNPDTAETTLPATAPWIGTGSGSRLPPQCSVVVTIRTGLASRRGRGRIYTGGYINAITDDNGRLTAGNQVFIQDFWNEVETQLAAQTTALEMGVLSRGWVNEGPEDPRSSYAQSFRSADSILVRDLNIDTQRRRVT